MAIVTIAPGANIPLTVASAPPGTTFRLAAGIHRSKAFTPRTGDIFEGVYVKGRRASILAGCRVLSSWTYERGRWWIGGQAQQGQVNPSGTLRPDYPRADYPEDLFMDDVLKRHVATLVDVEPGTWFFDYPANRIYVGDNPYGKLVETSVTPYVLTGVNGVSRVLFRDLIIEKYATPTATGALALGDSGHGGFEWEMARCEMRQCHGGAVWNDTQSITRDCYIHHIGGMALMGAGAGILIEGNEIAYNNTCGYDQFWGAGGSKWVWTTDLTVRGNFAHHNKGPALWTDINNLRTIYEDNRCEDNDRAGIFHEISYDATVRRNTCKRNGLGRDYPWWTTGAGIEIVGSRNVEVTENHVEDNWQGITGLMDHRQDPNAPHGPWELVNLHVHDNRVILGNPPAGGGQVGIVDMQGTGAFQPAARNRFERNQYVGEAATRRFLWNGQTRDWAGWQADGQDVTGTMHP